MKKIIILLFPLFLYATEGGGYGGFSIWMTQPDLKAMNDDIENIQNLRFEDAYIGMGGSGWAIIGRIVLGGGGFGGRQVLSNDSMKIMGAYGGGFFEPGYHLSMKRLSVDLILGIGGGGYTLTLYKGLKDTTWTDILSEPRRMAEITFGGFALQPALRIVLPISFIGISLKGGYIFYPSKPEPKFSDGGNVLNPPDVSLSGPFVSFSLVFGGKGGLEKGM